LSVNGLIKITRPPASGKRSAEYIRPKLQRNSFLKEFVKAGEGSVEPGRARHSVRAFVPRTESARSE
jgi:hypothetical protein